jgi:hypothetical protein
MDVKTRVLIGLLLSVLAVAGFLSAQQKAGVEMDRPGPIKAGGPIAFTVKLDEPLPKGARFDLRISPVSADEEIALGSGEPVKGSETVFRVAGTLPEDAIPGQWHISVVWFFLPGAGWTHRALGTNDLRFQVEGRAYPIPTKAEVTLDKPGDK